MKYYALIFTLTLLSSWCSTSFGFQGISPSDYQGQLGIGFSTDWFKTSNLGKAYSDASLTKTMSDLQSNGFNNLRLRSRADVWGFADSDPDNFVAATSIDQTAMNEYLAELDIVLDKSIAQGITPTISWIHHHAEGRANADDCDNFVQWWTVVATHTRDRSHALSYNLMTEIGKQDEDGDGVYGLYDSPAKWNDWTQRAITAIRGTGGNNLQRNIIITAPRNTQADSLLDINASILAQDNVLLEYHSYAAGPGATGRNEWSGTGTAEDRARLTDRLDALATFTDDHGIPIYWGAWTPVDLKEASLTQAEAEAFASFFAEELAKRNIAWSWNKLDHYYDTETNLWIEEGDIGVSRYDINAIMNSALSGHRRGAAAAAHLLGDCNLDGVVSFFDIARFIFVLSEASFLAEADVNQDNTVNFLDIPPFIGLFAGN